jgi:hypothetical protein
MIPAGILVLGDSFLRIFQQDEPGAAGFVAHLARQLQQPVTALINDGGASTLVRQQLPPNHRAFPALSHQHENPLGSDLKYQQSSSPPPFSPHGKAMADRSRWGCGFPFLPMWTHGATTMLGVFGAYILTGRWPAANASAAVNTLNGEIARVFLGGLKPHLGDSWYRVVLVLGQFGGRSSFICSVRRSFSGYETRGHDSTGHTARASSPVGPVRKFACQLAKPAFLSQQYPQTCICP